MCSEGPYVYQHYSWKQKRLIALKVPWHCPVVRWKRGTDLGSEECGVLEVGCWDVQLKEGAERLDCFVWRKISHECLLC